jgi:FAD/FMN-containing dehydrogenase
MSRLFTRRQILLTSAAGGLGLAAPRRAPALSHTSAGSTHAAGGAQLNQASLAKLAARFQGRLIVPQDADYDEARMVWNGAFSKRPALIARCANKKDVVSSIQFARECGLSPAIRSGGHSLAGKSTVDGGMVIDLSQMKRIDIGPDAASVIVQPGVTLGEFDAATQRIGAATTMGTEPSTGVAGLTLGGGLGWLMGKHGLACDNLIAVELVTAEGLSLRASVDENEDLFWAMRGAGANFGAATSLELRLHPVGPVLAGFVKYPPARLRDALSLYRDFSSTAPDEVGVELGLIPGANGPPTPSIAVCYCGDPKVGEKVLAPLRAMGPPLRDAIEMMPYERLQALGGVGPGKVSTLVRSGILKALDERTLDTIAAHAAEAPPMSGSFVLEYLHGAVTRVARTDAAFPHRDGAYSFAAHAFWWDSAQEERARNWVYAFWDAMQPLVRTAVYSNYLGDEGAERARASYGENYSRLLSLKRRFDPANFFRLNQNIDPRQS